MTGLETVLIGCGSFALGAVTSLFIGGKIFVFRTECSLQRETCAKVEALQRGVDESEIKFLAAKVEIQGKWLRAIAAAMNVRLPDTND